MQGILAFGYWETHPVPVIASWSVELGDALITELDRTKPEQEKLEPDADEWIVHHPGDPMPCGGNAKIFFKLAGGVVSPCWYRARYLNWGKDKGGDSVIAWKPAPLSNDDCFPILHAAARQQTEAFLRSIGKWEEDSQVNDA